MPQEREYAALQKAAPVARKKTAPRIERPTEERQRRIFSEHLERRDEIIEPDGLPAESRRIGEDMTELLEYNPGDFYIRRLIRPKYALPNGDGVVIGDLPSLPLARTNARGVDFSTVAGGQISGSSTAAPSDRHFLSCGRTTQSLDRLGLGAGFGRTVGAPLRMPSQAGVELRLYPDRRDDDSRIG